MLNGQRLILSPDGELPILSPKIRGSHQLITVPGQSVFFIVLPESKSRACTAVQIEEPKESYKNGGKIAQDEFDDTDYDTPVFDQEDQELVSSEKSNYVAFRHKYATKLADESTAVRRKNEERRREDNKVTAEENDGQESNNSDSQQPEPIVKYVTFSNNNWLSKFPKSLNNQEYSAERSSTYSPVEAATTSTVASAAATATAVEVQTAERGVTPPAQSRREKYHILAQAVVGKRYPEKTARFSSDNLYPNLESAVESIRPSQRLKLMKRSVDRGHDDLKDINEMLERFTNDERKPPSNTILNAADETSTVPVPSKPIEDRTDVPGAERPKTTVTQITNSAISETQRSTVPLRTSQETATTTAAVAVTTKPLRHERAESHVQKIKTRAEQALVRMAKLNEKTSQKLKGRRLQENPKEESTNPIAACRELTATSAPVSVTAEVNAGKTEPGFMEKFRYNRQTNGTTTAESDPKTVKSRAVSVLKSKKSTKTGTAVQENVDAASFLAAEPTDATATSASGKGAKLRTFAKTVKSTRSRKPERTDDWQSVTREIRDTTQHPARPKIRPLGKVKTPANVDAVQIETNGKVAEKLVENLRDGKKTLGSEHVAVGPSDGLVKNDDVVGETKLQEPKMTAGSLLANERYRALEARIKARRTETERRLHSRVHRVGKRSPPTNDMIAEDDATEHANGILRDGLHGDDGMFVVAGSDVARPVIDGRRTDGVSERCRRSVADITMKLNEVNTYVDKTEQSAESRNNEILGADDDDDGDAVSRPKDWTNAFRRARLPAAEYDGDESDGDVRGNAKSKRKSVFESLPLDDDDFGGKATADMMNKLLSQMYKIWKYIKKTFLF